MEINVKVLHLALNVRTTNEFAQLYDDFHILASDEARKRWIEIRILP